MTSVQKLVQIAFQPQDALHLGWTYASGLSAAGNSQATAATLSYIVNVYSTATAVNYGVILPTLESSPTEFFVIRNDDTDQDMSIYPAVGEYIDALAVNTPITLYKGGNAVIILRRNATSWVTLTVNGAQTEGPLTAGRFVLTGAGGQLTTDSDATFSTDTSTFTKTQVTTQARYGDASTNYTNFDSTGHQTMAGTAKPWDDMLIEPVARTTGANAPSFVRWLGDSGGTTRGVYLYLFDNATAGSEKELFFSMQMSHSWDSGTIKVHVHWMGNESQVNKTPRFGLEYTWIEPGGNLGFTTTTYATGNVQGDADIAANKHYITELVSLVPGSTQDGLSTILMGRLFRDSANAADTYTKECGIMYIDAHYQKARIGSTDEYTA